MTWKPTDKWRERFDDQRPPEPLKEQVGFDSRLFNDLLEAQQRNDASRVPFTKFFFFRPDEVSDAFLRSHDRRASGTRIKTPWRKEDIKQPEAPKSEPEPQPKSEPEAPQSGASARVFVIRDPGRAPELRPAVARVRAQADRLSNTQTSLICRHAAAFIEKHCTSIDDANSQLSIIANVYCASPSVGYMLVRSVIKNVILPLLRVADEQTRDSR